MNRGRSTSIVANPVLVGAVTVLVLIVAVFLAYNANNGLPFVPTRELRVQIDGGSNLVKGNDVREGGFRIGLVQALKPVTLSSGRTVALVTLKLDRKRGAVPVDSRITIRPRSALGLKYVEISKGRSRKEFGDGDTVALTQTSVPVQFDDVYSTFDKPTRVASRDNLREFGNAFAGRGQDLNEGIRLLPPLLRHLAPVAANLADGRTDIGRFFLELGNTVRVLAPVAATQARLFTDMATTFAAFSKDRKALQDTIAKSPDTLAVGTRSLRAQRPFLTHLAAFSDDLNGATSELRAALPIITPALRVGTPVLRRTLDMDARLADVFRAARDLAADPGTNLALRALTGTVATLNPQLRFLGPYQTVCDYWNYFWTYLSEHFSEPDPTGYSQRALLNSAGAQDNSVGTAGAFAPANGEGFVAPTGPSRGDIQFLHGGAYSAAIANDGSADCENGQRGYVKGPLAVFGSPKYKTVIDPHIPGNQGPTFAGRQRVPAGETFTREPTTGALLPPEQTTGP